MAITSNTYTGNGSNKLFSITFPYLEESDVDVYLNGTLQTITTQYSFANATTIEFVTAPANGATVKLDRSTDDSDNPATFFPGSSIKANDLNANFDQTLYVVQEINNNAVKLADPLYVNKTYIDAADATKVNKSGDTMTGNLAMSGNRVTGLGTPSLDADSATKLYVDQRYGELGVPGLTRWRKIATAGQTVFSGVGEDGNTLAYSSSRESVFINGAYQQRGVDYTANDGSSITVTPALIVGDVVDVHCVNNAAGVATDQASGVYFTQSGAGAATRTVDSKLKDVVSVKDFGAVGDGVADDTAALNAAAVAAGVAKKALFVPAGIYKTTAPWVIPPRVYVKGESHSIQPGYDPGNLWNFGAVIFKAHTGNAITKTGSTPYEIAAPIENITISSNRTTYPGGNGFVLDSVAGANLFYCRAFGVGGDSFVIGVSAATNTGNNLMEGCYSNNPTGVNYRVRQGYSRINNCLSDGGTYGMRLDNCPLVVVNNFHFEGFSSAGIYLENGCTSLKFNSGLLVNSAAALYGVQIASGAGSGHTFNGVSVYGGANTASSVGVSIPSNSVNNRILNCEVCNWATGVDNNANYGANHTWIIDSAFVQNNLAIRSNGENTIYRGNSFDVTIGTWDVSHVSGTKGIWSGNTFGKGALGINPVATGVQGNFSGIRVKENTGYISRNSGTTGSIAAYTNIAHGLAGAPKYQLILTSNSPGITSVPQIASLDATNFSLYWTGTATPQWNWEAALPCDY